MPGAVEIHWRRLRFSLAAFAAASLAGGAAATAAWWHEHRILEGMEAAEIRLAEARGRYAALAAEREERRRFAPRYRRLAARGRLGEEQPARWTEALRSAGTEVAAARHRLGSTHLVENIGPVEVRATDLSLEIELRHEAELPRFLAALEREAPGMFTVSGCRLVRTDGSGAEEPSPAAVPGATVGAACRIRWQSVVLSGVEPGWTPAPGPDDGSDAGDAAAGAEAVPAEPPRETFGRLFTTVAERARIDAVLAARNAAADQIPGVSPVRSEPPPRRARWVRVGGVVARSERSVFAWIDGRRIAYGGSLPERPAPAGPRPPGVRIDAGGGSILVRPGQRFDPDTGAVSDPIRSPEERSRRGRSLRGSSAPPLTHLPAPGQN